VITQIYLKNVRNIKEARLCDLAAVNLISGKNGSGKTSVLEAIYLLAAGRSFRTHKIKNIICFEQSELAVSLKLDNPALMIGTLRGRDSSKVLKVGGEKVSKLSEIAEYLPVQAIHADTFELLTGGPGVRRRFLDWGVFHVEHQFLGHWKQCERSLKQRNELLRRDKIEASSLELWTQQFIDHAERVDDLRTRYFADFKQMLKDRLRGLGLPPVVIEYYRGWRTDSDLREQLELSVNKDFQRGLTSIGPHRADVRVKVNGINAGEVLSRGQQKLLVAMMMVVQGEHLNQCRDKSTVYLVDDLPAELDDQFQHYFVNVLEQTKAQVFITGIEAQELMSLWSHTPDLPVASDAGELEEGHDTENKQQTGMVRMFHVEHGCIESV
jgi:DNA replication and repair protein RecF